MILKVQGKTNLPQEGFTCSSHSKAFYNSGFLVLLVGGLPLRLGGPLGAFFPLGRIPRNDISGDGDVEHDLAIEGREWRL